MNEETPADPKQLVTAAVAKEVSRLYMQIDELQSRIDKLEGQTDQLADEHTRMHDTFAAAIAINNDEVKRQLEDFERGLANRERRTFG